MTSPVHNLAVSLACIAFTGLAANAHGVGAGTPPAELLAAVEEHYGALDRVSCHVEVSLPDPGTVVAEPMLLPFEFTFERPNRLAWRPKSDAAIGGTLVSDGADLWILSPEGDRYLQRRTPDGPAGWLLAFPDLAVVTPSGALELEVLGALLDSAPAADLMRTATGVVERPGQEIRGLKTRCLRVQRAVGSIDLWIAEAEDEPPWLMAMAPVSPDLERVAPVRAVFTGWRAVSDESEFSFRVPTEARPASTFLGTTVVAPGFMPEILPEILPETDIELTLLEGDPVALAGSAVTVLEFWATWCEPCQRGMIRMDALASRIGPEVRFFAVNVREPEETVRAYGESRAFENLELVLDPDGEISERYEVYAIPRTVILKDGEVVLDVLGHTTQIEQRIEDVLLRVAR